MALNTPNGHFSMVQSNHSFLPASSFRDLPDYGAAHPTFPHFPAMESFAKHLVFETSVKIMENSHPRLYFAGEAPALKDFDL